jgi:small subunit ribosomal protein S17
MNEKIENKGKKREIKGVVTGNKMDKTVKVAVNTLQAHPVYKKVIKKEKVFFAHTEDDLEIGDKVTIRESKPFSKKVRWLVIDKEE